MRIAPDDTQFYSEPLVDVDGNKLSGNMRPPKRPELSPKNFGVLRDFFVKLYVAKYGFEPEPQRGEYMVFVKMRKRYDAKELMNIVRFFIASEKSEKHPSFNACFSGHTITLYKQQQYRDNQKYR